METLIDMLPKAWPFSELPGYRETSQPFATYSGFSYADLPPVTAEADAQFRWLQNEPVKSEWSLLDWNGEVRRTLAEREAAGELRLPPPFVTFLRSPDLQSRVRSCTACYLLMPEFAVPTAGVEEGHLIHFLSDQQWCLHWSLYVGSNGRECVICSEKAYGFEEDEEEASSLPIDLVKEGAAFCAPSFQEFMYRFWIENEIYFALDEDTFLTARQQAYLEHYQSLKQQP